MSLSINDLSDPLVVSLDHLWRHESIARSLRRITHAGANSSPAGIPAPTFVVPTSTRKIHRELEKFSYVMEDDAFKFRQIYLTWFICDAVVLNTLPMQRGRTAISFALLISEIAAILLQSSITVKLFIFGPSRNFVFLICIALGSVLQLYSR